jgi:tetratricopeptide (TPR) repeat protein
LSKRWDAAKRQTIEAQVEQVNEFIRQGDKALEEQRFADAVASLEKALSIYSGFGEKARQLEPYEHLRQKVNGARAQLCLRLQQEGQDALNVGDFELAMALWEKVEVTGEALIVPPGPEGESLRKTMRHEVSSSRLKTLNACLTCGDEARKAGQLDQAIQWYDRGLKLMSGIQNKLFTSIEAYQENYNRVAAMRDKTKSDELRKQGQAAWAAQDYEKAAPLLEESNKLLLPFSGEPAIANILKSVRLQLFQHYVRAAGKAEQERNLARTEEYYSKILAVAEPYVEISDIAQAVYQVLLARGLIYHGQGNYRMALADFQKSVEVCPNNELAHYNAACAYARLGQRDQALQALRRSFELDAAKGQKTWVTAAKTDSDFDSLRTMSQFRALLAQFGA